MHEAAWDRPSEASLALCAYVYALMISSMSAKQIQALKGQWPMQINNTSDLSDQVSWSGVLALATPMMLLDASTRIQCGINTMTYYKPVRALCVLDNCM